ncbi:hypothetical protein R3P38DRAFT_2815300 [Favolaschia claudopus]|uniref:BZIP domain-containing protein n=1 Tax=Favolaschia claudopus TaxID=2862362 RepID=A0AAV9Z1Y8_9AGAR
MPTSGSTSFKQHPNSHERHSDTPKPEIPAPGALYNVDKPTSRVTLPLTENDPIPPLSPDSNVTAAPNFPVPLRPPPTSYRRTLFAPARLAAARSAFAQPRRTFLHNITMAKSTDGDELVYARRADTAHKYRMRNKELSNERAKLRMRDKRQQIRQGSSDLQLEHRIRAKLYRRTYRARCKQRGVLPTAPMTNNQLMRWSSWLGTTIVTPNVGRRW